jgi:cell wall-associated NlpC family hydrolase
VAARKKYGTVGSNKTLNYGGDCGNFVATVIRASGADPKYPVSGTDTQISYLEKSSKWQEITHKRNIKNLEPGDVFIVRRYDLDKGHTYIYIGGGKKAQAAMGDQMPWYGGSVNWTEWNKQYRVFRLVKK